MGIWIKVRDGIYECNLCRGRCKADEDRCNYKYCPRCGIKMNLQRSLSFAVQKETENDTRRTEVRKGDQDD